MPQFRSSTTGRPADFVGAIRNPGRRGTPGMCPAAATFPSRPSSMPGGTASGDRPTNSRRCSQMRASISRDRSSPTAARASPPAPRRSPPGCSATTTSPCTTVRGRMGEPRRHAGGAVSDERRRTPCSRTPASTPSPIMASSTRRSIMPRRSFFLPSPRSRKPTARLSRAPATAAAARPRRSPWKRRSRRWKAASAASPSPRGWRRSPSACWRS